MPPRTRKPKAAPLGNRLVLHRFACREFGYHKGMDEMLDRLRGIPADIGPGGESEYARALYLDPQRATVAREHMVEYDANIAAHSRRLRMTGEHGRTWKPHQWLALLFTEHYLRRWFDDPETLRADLNRARLHDPLTQWMPGYETDDLRTLAFQSATGSGKTLLMHAHILQYRHYRARAGKRPVNVVLVTPNEQLSAQHERELDESGLHARLFSSAAGADLLAPIEIVDINKLAERKGIKRVAVSDFGGDNLVLVDEGHLGASGKAWRERRAALSRGGFTFEYSATFNQITAKDESLRDAYGKCLLFDYPYRAFHADGYGKDYAISNLPGGAEDANSRMYLLGCLLSFYRQCRIWRDGHAGWQAFNVARPLWVFLGKTVTGNSRADRETRSDVLRILDFLAWVLAHGETVRPMIARLLTGESGLTDDSGRDYFAGRFGGLEGEGAGAIYDDVCQTLFHGKGRLHVVYLTAGEGELHLRSADNPPFGVVNVGDSAALHRLLVEAANPDLAVEREAGFAERLFAHVDRAESTVNLIVGARRFIAGWNSWRVSTMGLMHVGVGEGPEIVQMFGRGVRLKGWNMSLKRHRESGAEPPADGGLLAELETLRIFGLRAAYMQTFRELLRAEGIGAERETITLPVTWNFARKDLKILRLEEGTAYDRSDDRPTLPPPGPDAPPVVEMDLYSRLQTAQAGAHDAAPGTGKAQVRLDRRHVAFFDRARIHDRLLARKRRMGWNNLAIEREVVDRLLDDDGWYTLRAPPERLAVRRVEDLRALEALAVDLIAEYADRFWRKRRRRWEHANIDVTTLGEADPNNIREYRLSVDAAKKTLVEDVRGFAALLRDGSVCRLMNVGAVMADTHAYRPLLYAAAGKGEISVQPVPLDDSERKVVEALAGLAKTDAPCLRGRELYLIRNMTRGRGLSFFDDFAYYPDFIVWLKDEADQHVVFLDPKGLGRYGPKERRKVRLHAAIKETEARVREADPALRLHAYVLSVTAPQNIGDESRPQREWEKRGVYFLHDPTCLRRIIEHTLAA